MSMSKHRQLQTMFGNEDVILKRLSLLESMVVTEGKVPVTLNRKDLTQLEKLSKVRKYKLTQDKKFNSNGGEVYRKLRKDFFKHCRTQGILVDLMFNYQDQNGSGLTLKDRFGPYDFLVDVQTGRNTKPTMPELPPNPFGLSMDQCEQAAEDIREAMLFPGPMMVQLNKCKERNQPIMFLFGLYDKMFFTTVKKKAGNLRATFLAIVFNNNADVRDTLSI